MKGLKGYGPTEHVAPISQFSSSSMVLVMRDNLYVKNVKELIVYSRSGLRKLRLVSVGVDGATHLDAEMRHAGAGLEYVHVPLKGSGPPASDLMTGELGCTLLRCPLVSGFLKGENLYALAKTSLNNYALNPELPVISENTVGYEPTAGTSEQIEACNVQDVPRWSRSNVPTA